MEKILSITPELIEKGVEGAVFFVDGGMRHVLGKVAASYGIHAYFFKNEIPKKAQCGKDFVPTKYTYLEKGKAEEKEKVTVLYYYDAFGNSPGGTNQTGEMDAFIQALTIILETKLYEQLKTIRIYSDSQYVVEGSQKWILGWKNNNWVNSSGQPVSSKERWLRIDKLWTEVKEKCQDIEFKWVKGHAGNFGNELADYQATTSLFHPDESRELIATPENYNDTDNASNKLLLDSKMYHLNELERKFDVLTKDDMDLSFNQYLTFSHPSQGFDIKSDVGKAVRDFGLGLILLKEEDELIEKTISACNKVLNRVADVPVVIFLQNVIKSNNRPEIMDGLVDNFNVNSEGIVKSISNDTLFLLVDPSRLAYKLRPIYSDMSNKLYGWLTGEDKDIIYTDITNMFYDEVVKKKKTTLKFKLSAEASFNPKVDFMINGEIKTLPVTLTFGNDTPPRRTFNGIADSNPKIGVLTWQDCDNLYKYALLVQTDEGMGMWCGAFDNTIHIR